MVQPFCIEVLSKDLYGCHMNIPLLSCTDDLKFVVSARDRWATFHLMSTLLVFFIVTNCVWQWIMAMEIDFVCLTSDLLTINILMKPLRFVNLVFLQLSLLFNLRVHFNVICIIVIYHAFGKYQYICFLSVKYFYVNKVCYKEFENLIKRVYFSMHLYTLYVHE